MTKHPVVIRRAVQADAGAISSLLRDSFREFEALYTPAAFAATVQPEPGILERIEQGPTWVAEKSGAPIGTVSAVNDGDSFAIRGMAVDPSARGLGVGRMLLGCVESFAACENFNSLSLFTTSFLTSAIRLYEAAGFEFTGEAASPHGVELLRMMKKVKQAHQEGEPNTRLVEHVFRQANFVRSLGIELSAFGFGWCETQLTVSSAVLQQHGFVHGGVLMALADHTCGGAAASTVPEDKDLITVENKMSFLRPAAGQVLKCRAEVLRTGKNLIFVEAAVTSKRADRPIIVAKASSTLAVNAPRRPPPNS